MNRRRLIVTGAIAAGAAVFGLGQRYPQWRERRAFDTARRVTRARLARSFPESILATPTSTDFVEAFAAAHLGDPIAFSMDHVVGLFVTSTTVIAAVEQGEPMDFSGLFAPYRSPCSNHLAAHMAPRSEFDS